MPINFIFDIQKKQFDNILKKKDSNSDKKLELKLPVEISLENEELEILKNFLKTNEQLEYLKINLPGSFNFKDLLTDELSKEKVPNLKITIQEKFDQIATTNINEFMWG